MKLLNILMKDIKVFNSQFVQNMFMLLVFPIIIGLLYGIMYENILENKLELNTLKVFVLNEDDGVAGTAFDSLMESDSLAFIDRIGVADLQELNSNIDRNKNAVGIILGKELSQKLMNGEKTDFRILDKGNITIEKTIFNSILKNFTDNMNINFQAAGIIAENSLSQDEVIGKIERFTKLNSEISAVNFVESTKTEGKTKISSIAMFLTSIFVIFAFFINTEFLAERDKHILSRVIASGASSKTVFWGNFLSIFSLTFFISGIYFLISYYFIVPARPFVLDFLGAIALLSVMIASFYAFIIGFFTTERTMKIFFGMIFFAFIMFGGSFYPADQFSITAKVAVFTPNFNMQKILESLVSGGNLAQEGVRIISLLIICSILTLTGLFMFEKKVKA